MTGDVADAGVSVPRERLITMALLALSTSRISIPDTALPGRREAGLVRAGRP